jgi:hypothetical protein
MTVALRAIMTRVSKAQNALFSLSCGVALLGCAVAVEDGGEVIATEEEEAFFLPAAPVLLPAAPVLLPEPPVLLPETPEIALYADIQFVSSTIRLYDYSATESLVYLNVINAGNSPVLGGTGRVYTSNVVRYGSLRTSNGGVVVNPGQAAFISVIIPKEFARQCQKHAVQIDLDHVWQYDDLGGTEVFDNDSANLDAPCLTWTSPITYDTLGSAPNPEANGKSLAQIVSSFEIGSSLGRCSSCHYKNTPVVTDSDYSPNNILMNQATSIFPSQRIDFWRWSGPDGWAARFLYADNKPEPLKKVMRKWLENGARL